MALTSIGAIYATQSLLLQRIYIPHADDNEIAQQQVGVGETLINVPLATYEHGGAPAVQNLIGAPTFSGRCAVVAASAVIDHVIADPALYSDPRGQVIPSDISMIGDTWDGTAFHRAFIELDHTKGTIVAASTQPILSAAPTVNALNYLLTASVSPTAVIGASVPGVTARIVSRVAAKAAI